MTDQLVEPGPNIEQVAIEDGGEFVIATPETAGEWVSCDSDSAIHPEDWR